MSGLIYQNNNKCQGWTNPSDNFFGPQILTLSSFYSPAGSTSLVNISGVNFYSYSSVSFGVFNPTVYFVNSNLLQFYVPNTLNFGTYPVQVFNGSIPSNIVNYTIDNASGYWLLNMNKTITNTNPYSVAVTSLSRGAPVTITDTSSGPYVILNNVSWIIGNGSADITLSLPFGTEYIGRELMIKNINPTNRILSSQQNIKPFDSLSPLDASYLIIDPIFYKWVTLICFDGLYWMIMQYG